LSLTALRFDAKLRRDGKKGNNEKLSDIDLDDIMKEKK
jgi:hypothetical protein